MKSRRTDTRTSVLPCRAKHLGIAVSQASTVASLCSCLFFSGDTRGATAQNGDCGFYTDGEKQAFVLCNGATIFVPVPFSRNRFSVFVPRCHGFFVVVGSKDVKMRGHETYMWEQNTGLVFEFWKWEGGRGWGGETNTICIHTRC